MSYFDSKFNFAISLVVNAEIISFYLIWVYDPTTIKNSVRCCWSFCFLFKSTRWLLNKQQLSIFNCSRHYYIVQDLVNIFVRRIALAQRKYNQWISKQNIKKIKWTTHKTNGTIYYTFFRKKIEIKSDF